ncbi:MAG: 50S ribosomal protein L17 [Alphaproteobacteria bacterium]|nr:50S ribosomal protein L17 [Alphaproteobacteria bacterium]
MRHQNKGRKFGRDTNARKALFRGLSKNLIEREQIKTTLPKAKDLRGVVEKLITRAKVDTVANRRLVAAELQDAALVKKIFTVLGPRYKDRPGGYTRVLRAGFRYGDAAPMAIIELVDRDAAAKDNPKAKGEGTKAEKAEAKAKTPKAAAAKVQREAAPIAKATGTKTTAARRRTVAG